MQQMTSNRWIERAMGAERAVERRVGEFLRDRPDWQVEVAPYTGHGTTTRCHLLGRVLVRRREPSRRDGPIGSLLTTFSRYATVDLPAVPVSVEVAGHVEHVVSGPEGYLEATVELPDVAVGWHVVTYRAADGEPVDGPLLVVDPQARLGVISDLDDTVIHTGLTNTLTALHTTLLVADEARAPIAGAAELYQGLATGAGGQSPVVYVSAGAWNLYQMLVGFLERTGFPPGPLLLTDWGPSQRWLFREDSVQFKTRTIRALLEEHPQVSWVLVGDSGQHDAEAYAEVARQHPGRVRAVYIRDVAPATPQRTARVTKLANEISALGVPMLLVPDSAAAAEHAQSVDLVDAATVRRVQAAVGS